MGPAQAGQQGVLVAEVAGEPHPPHALVTGMQGADPAPGAVAAAIVDDDELPGETEVAEHGLERLEEVLHVSLLVVGGSDDGELGCCRSFALRGRCDLLAEQASAVDPREGQSGGLQASGPLLTLGPPEAVVSVSQPAFAASGRAPRYGRAPRAVRRGGLRAVTRLWCVGLLLCGCLVPYPAAAASITLRLLPELAWRDGTLSLSLEILNEGDTPARAVTPALWFAGRGVRGDAHPALFAGDTHEAQLELASPLPGPGRWPYRIAVDYTDSSQHPFQALAAGTLVVGTPPPVEVELGEVPALRLSRRGALALRVANRGTQPYSVTLSLHLPQGIESAAPIPSVELAGGQERSLRVPLQNRSALPGSRYAVFVSAEYDGAGVHQALVIPASVEIVASESLLEAWAPWLFGAAAALVTVWVAAVAGLRLAGRQ